MATVAPTRRPEDIAKARFLKQRDLEDLAERLERAADLKKELKALAEDIEKRELVIIHAIEHGANTEKGDLSASVTVDKGQTRPKWKEEFAKIAGPSAVESVIKATTPSADTKHVVVSRKGVAL